jgi:hypothetical protein
MKILSLWNKKSVKISLKNGKSWQVKAGKARKCLVASYSNSSESNGYEIKFLL